MTSMLRPTALTTVLLAAAFGAACGKDTPTAPSAPEPVSVSETFSDVLNPNGGRTHPFIAERAGQVTAVINATAPNATAVVGLSLGTWNGIACQIVLANDNATAGQTLVATASNLGQFCVRVYDTGRLTENTEYSVTVTHF